MLSSQYKPHDPLAAEFIRTFRHQNFTGTYYLHRYDALSEKKATMDVRILLPRSGFAEDSPDNVAIYGFRSVHPDLFFLSPWEFCQWYKPHRLRAPGKDYHWTKFTAAGRARLAEEQGQKIVWRPGTDFELNEERVAIEKHLYPYPPWQAFFAHPNDTYAKFRNTWLLIRRQRPMVPCPERCPLPGKRMSKDTRAKILSVYFRPWTLACRVATATVPYLPHLSHTQGELMQATDADRSELAADGALQRKGSIRKAWKEYLQRVLPHAREQLQNFMLACMAEGRAHAEEDDETSHRRNTSLYCQLSLEQVKAALDFQAKKAMQSTARETHMIRKPKQQPMREYSQPPRLP